MNYLNYLYLHKKVFAKHKHNLLVQITFLTFLAQIVVNIFFPDASCTARIRDIFVHGSARTQDHATKSLTH